MDNEQLPKGYKNTEVGVIPEDWEVKKLGEVIYLQGGYAFKSELFTNVGVPIIRISDVGNNKVETDNSVCYEPFNIPKEFVAKKGDVLIAMSGATTGKIGVYNYDGIAYINQRVGKFVVLNQNETSQEFISHIVRSEKFKENLTKEIAQGAQPNISGKQIQSIVLPIPNEKEEQTAIANALSDTDALINSLEKLIAKKRNIKQGAMQHLLKPKEGWEVKKLGSIGKPYGGLSGKSKTDFEDGKFPYIPFMNIMSNPIIDTSYVDYVNIGVNENQNKALKGDLFFNGSSETPEEVGMCSVLLEDIPNLYLNSFCFGFRLNKDSKENGLYLSYYFRSSEGRKLFYSMAQGATRYNLSKSNFNKMEVSLPQPEQQNEIATILSDMDAEIQALETKLEKYRKIKLGMMQNLLTGKIRLV